MKDMGREAREVNMFVYQNVKLKKHRGIKTTNKRLTLPGCGLSTSRLTERGVSRARWDTLQMILVPGTILEGTVRWDDRE